VGVKPVLGIYVAWTLFLCSVHNRSRKLEALKGTKHLACMDNRWPQGLGRGLDANLQESSNVQDWISSQPDGMGLGVKFKHNKGILLLFPN
jgi:hypothetical protein